MKAYIQFDNTYSVHSELLLSPESLIINKNVYEKIAIGHKLTESEEEYRDKEAEIVNLMDEIFIKYFKNTVSNSEFYFKMRRIFINFVFMIRQTIITGKLLRRPEEEINEDLDVIINIIELGIKNYH